MVITDQLAEESLLEGEGYRESDKIFEDLRCNSPPDSTVPQPETIPGPEYSKEGIQAGLMLG